MKLADRQQKSILRKSIAPFLLFSICLFGQTAFGQFKVPKIFKPKQNPPTTSQPNTPQETVRQTEVTAPQTVVGSGIDDGFTWFEAVSFQEPVNGKSTTLGWALKSSLRLMGEHPRRSAFKIAVSKAGKPLTTIRCEAFLNEADRWTGVTFLVANECFKKETAIKELGKFDVQITFINGDTDAETPLRNYKIEVLKADRVTGPTTQPIADAPQYYISRHAEAPATIMFQRPEGRYPYDGYGNSSNFSGAGANEVEIYFSLSPSKEGNGAYMRSNYLRCTVDGKPLEMQNDKVAIETVRRYAQVHSDRLTAEFKSGTPYRDEIEFLWLRADLPFTFGTNAPDAFETNFNNHPGKWECHLTNNGATLRTWRWTVGRNGMVSKHAEQNGNINLFYNSFLLDTEIPAGGTLIDKRLASVSLAEGLFYGLPWTTAEGKAMAGKVPTKGSPAPVPSNKLK